MDVLLIAHCLTSLCSQANPFLLFFKTFAGQHSNLLDPNKLLGQQLD